METPWAQHSNQVAVFDAATRKRGGALNQHAEWGAADYGTEKIEWNKILPK
jgi:hypothetical protein